MIVMKFGGTSVEDAKAIDRAAAIVEGRLAQQPVVVVSAMAKVTDQLLQHGAGRRSGRSRDRAEALAASCGNAITTPPENCWAPALFTQFHSDLEAEFDALDELLRGIAAVGELTPRTTDHVAAYGELLSSKIGDRSLLRART